MAKVKELVHCYSNSPHVIPIERLISIIGPGHTNLSVFQACIIEENFPTINMALKLS